MVEETSNRPPWHVPGHAVDMPDVLVATETCPDGDTIIIRARGELDIASAPVLRRRLLELTALPVRGLTVDIGGVTFMDSSGLGALEEALLSAEEHGVKFTLVQVPEHALQVLRLTNMAGRFELADESGPDGHAPPNVA
jgi:anti-sigma B factor antagonist